MFGFIFKIINCQVDKQFDLYRIIGFPGNPGTEGIRMEILSERIRAEKKDQQENQ
jgi:hypothetical protein